MKLVISALDDMRAFHGKVSHLISIIDPEDVTYVAALGLSPDRRLLLTCHDVESVAEAKARERDFPGSRCSAPTSAMVRKALGFARSLSDEDTLLIHCGHGISRSTAVAFAILCQASPKSSEDLLFQELLKLRPQACPNTLIIKIAEKLLKREGKMTRAITAHSLKGKDRRL